MIHVVSDATGNTAERMVRAALVQFTDHQPELRIWSKVRTVDMLDKVLSNAQADGAMIVHTLVNQELSEHLHRQTRSMHIRCLDLIGPMLSSFSDYFDEEPAGLPGIRTRLDDSYFRRVEAIEFTVHADDGRGVDRVHLADIVLVGVSRTSKTPVATFLAGRGFKVANIPLIEGVEPPKALDSLDKNVIFGLTVSPDTLVEIRSNRVRRLNLRRTGNYASIESVQAELEWAESLYRAHKWPMIDVTDLAIEEIASEILKRRGPQL